MLFVGTECRRSRHDAGSACTSFALREGSSRRRRSHIVKVVGYIDRGADEPTPSFLKAVLDWPQPFVPVIADRRLEMVVDRSALADQLARMFVADLAGEPRRAAY